MLTSYWFWKIILCTHSLTFILGVWLCYRWGIKEREQMCEECGPEEGST